MKKKNTIMDVLAAVMFFAVFVGGPLAIIASM